MCSVSPARPLRMVVGPVARRVAWLMSRRFAVARPMAGRIPIGRARRGRLLPRRLAIRWFVGRWFAAGRFVLGWFVFGRLGAVARPTSIIVMALSVLTMP